MATYSIYSNTASATTKHFFETDGNTTAWYDYTDLTTITKNVAEQISLWKDKLLSGRDLAQAGAVGIRPVYQSTGILFDGSNDYIRGNFVYNQPEFIYVVLKQITWNANDTILDGYTGATTGCLYQTGITPQLKAYGGASSAANGNLVLDTWSIIRLLFNGVSSKLQINATASTTGNFGATNMTGFCLGLGGGGGYANIEVKEIILRSIADSSANETLIYNYLKAKYSL